MRQFLHIAIGVVCGAFVVGCRAATRVAEVPRVDLSLQEGNRGYLIGRPPEAAQSKTTRQMVQTDIELPSFYKPQPIPNAPVGLGEIAPTGRETSGEGMHLSPAAGAEPDRSEAYVVQKGESLWSIAAKPEVYGSATRWRAIFNANRDVLKNPDGIRPGMTLKIPRGNPTGGSAPAQDEGTTFKK